jgi:hypothetical protein
LFILKPIAAIEKIANRPGKKRNTQMPRNNEFNRTPWFGFLSNKEAR